jgi:trimeric autotransporter adhesin
MMENDSISSGHIKSKDLTPHTFLSGVIDVDQNTYILAESSPGANEDTLFFYTAGSERMRIASNGNIGIGTTSPSKPLSVQGNALISGNLTAGGLTATGTISLLGLGRNMVLTSDASGNIVASSTPTAAAYFATSTATSTFVGGIQTGGIASSNGLTITGGSINLSSGATSTFNNGINLTGGCFQDSIGNCVTTNASTLGGLSASQLLRSDTSDNFNSGTLTFDSGTTIALASGSTLNLANTGANMLLSTDSSGNVVSTSTPSVAALFATSTTATSTFAGGLVVGPNNSALSNLYVSPTNSKVGIGTTSPNWLLQVNGTKPSFALSDSSAGTGLKHWIFSSQGGNLYVGTSTDNYATSSPAALTILNNGRIGIGTSSPVTSLSIFGGITSAGSGDNSELYGRGASGSGNGLVIVGAGASASRDRSVAIGFGAIAGSATGDNVVAIGYLAKSINSGSGGNSVLIGSMASSTNSETVGIGALSFASGGSSVVIGYQASSSAQNSILIGYGTASAYGNTVAIGKSASTNAAGQFVVGSKFSNIYDYYLGAGAQTDGNLQGVFIQPTRHPECHRFKLDG